MFINIRGTSGSGKSTLVRKLMEHPAYALTSRVRAQGRKQPLGYMFHRRNGSGRGLYVAGHYETACGGCDTIPSYDENYSHIRKAHSADMDVVFEGLLISAENRRLIELHNDYPGLVYVIALDVPLDVCLESINSRRRVKKPEAVDVNPKNTESKHKGVKSSMKKLAEAGVASSWENRDTAYAKLVELLQLP